MNLLFKNASTHAVAQTDATESATTTPSFDTYKVLINEFSRCPSGHDKAGCLVVLFNCMKQDGLDFFDLFRKSECTELQTMMALPSLMVPWGYDQEEDIYFYPDETGTCLAASSDTVKSAQAWSNIVSQVIHFSMDSVYADHQMARNPS